MTEHDWKFIGVTHATGGAGVSESDRLLAICRRCGLVRQTFPPLDAQFSIDLSGECETAEDRKPLAEPWVERG